MAHDLVEHVVEEGHAGIERADTGTIKVDGATDLGFFGIADYFRQARGHGASGNSGEAEYTSLCAVLLSTGDGGARLVV
jgi:hypothetical protein